MLYLVISTPHPSRPDEMKAVRLQFWDWVADLKSKGKVICFYPRVGRGVIVIFDVASNEELHQLMTQWLNIVPVSFDIYPLAKTSEVIALLK